MRKNSILIMACLLGFVSQLMSQTIYTSQIANPSFELGNGDGWQWIGADGYAWLGPNTDGDGTKDGAYINGIWNASIGDLECSQTVTGLPAGNYLVTALVTVSTNRVTNQRLFASADGETISQLFGNEDHLAYSANNLSILETNETYSFGGFAESAAENGPFHKLSVVKQVSSDTLTIGIRVSGKSSSQGYDFTYSTKGDAGFFKFDNFSIAEVSNVATLDAITLSTGFLDVSFDPTTFTYSATLPEGTTTVTPLVKETVDGVTVTGAAAVDVTSGSGVSTIKVVALDANASETYTINYVVASSVQSGQQEKLYTNEFALADVKLLDGPFKHACDLNINTLLAYDVDRLLAPYRKEAGLSVKAESYSNWIGLDGHIGGHYLTAMAINYAATKDTVCERLMNYMVTELKACQDANTTNFSAWGEGYAGGVPGSSAVWSKFKSGDFSSYNAAWVPWYNLHKTYAGLRDAWLYGESETAKTVFLNFCDWAVSITAGLSDTQMETMLDVEHGGMNEVLADAYQMTGDAKYLTAAKRFSHKDVLNSMAVRSDNLDNMHANTQVPKAVGFQRIAELSKEARYVNAAEYFWKTVTEDRTIALGGNSIKEYFPEASACKNYIHDVEGPESCNTNNMLKLTENLFRVSPEAKYADYYEQALYNHILSTQHPEHGGYVYFTPARPRHYRVYSSPNKAMWCCVGTGMENHGKYNEFIYTHHNNALYLNLFVASELNWRDKGVLIRQETTFPYEEKTKLIISTDTPVAFNLKVRSPKWVAEGALKIVVNTDTLQVVSVPETYISIDRTWSNGDSVHILLPMHNTVEHLPNVSAYVAVKHGPILLGAKTGTNNLSGLIADDSRWGHIASGELQPINEAPLFVTAIDSIASKIVPIEGEAMKFKANNLFPNKMDTALVLEPFYNIHDARYMMYWLAVTEDQYQKVLDSLASEEKKALELEARTIDQVAPGEQQPEADHNMKILNSYTGNWQNEFWRDARNNGYVSYQLATNGASDLTLLVRYWGNESGSRTFDIMVDDEKLITENVVGKWNVDEFVNVEYAIPNSMVAGKELVTVKFQAVSAGNVVGGLFYVRMLEPLKDVGVANEFVPNKTWKVQAQNQRVIVSELPANATVKVFDVTGRLLAQTSSDQDNVTIPLSQRGVVIVQVLSGHIPLSHKVVVP